MEFVIFDGCVCPKLLEPFLQRLQKDAGCHYNAIYRGDSAIALLHQLGKHSQRELFNGWITRQPGFLPANRPGTSTHELKSDGVAYPGPVGRSLEWWQCGIDVNDNEVDRVIASAKKLGWTVWRPYPGTQELHHVNFKFAPRMPVEHKGTYAQWAKWYRGGKKGKRPNVPTKISDAWWKKLEKGDVR